MNRHDWLAADPRRGRPDHVAYGDGWTFDDPAQTRTVGWAPGTGELYTLGEGDHVEVLGVFADRHAVEAAAAGWSAQRAVPGSLYRLRAAAHDASLAEPAQPHGAEREPSPLEPSHPRGARYRIGTDDGSWWELGWDRPLRSYYAQHYQPAAGPAEPDTLIAWHGTTERELPDLDDLERVITRPLEPAVAADLAVDQSYFPSHTRPPYLDFTGEQEADAVHADDLAGHPSLGYHHWVRADPARAGVHVDLGSRWTGDDSVDVRRLSWAPGTGEVYTLDADDGVEVLGILRTEEELTDALRGWETRSLEPDSLSWAWDAVDAAEQRGEPDERRVRASTYDEWLAAEPARRTPHPHYGTAWTAEEGGTPHRVSWVPATGELYAVEQLHGNQAGMVDVLGMFSSADAVDTALDGWASHVDQIGSLYWLRDTVATAFDHRIDGAGEPRPHAAVDGVDDGREARGPREEALDAREADLERRERQVAAQQAALRAAIDVEPHWTLPAAPVAELLHDVQRGTGDNIATVAKGLDVDPAWAAEVVAGRATEVDLPHVQQLCQALHCSPYDLWGSDDAQHILHAYGPELWPRFIEPLQPADLELPDVPPAGPDLDL